MLTKNERLVQLQDISIHKEGLCLAAEYHDANTTLPFRCKYGHIWYALPSNIKHNHWCPYCTGHKIIDPLAFYQQFALAKGGRCLSTEYVNTNTPLTFECTKLHIWSTKPINIRNKGHWCPQCSSDNGKFGIRPIITHLQDPLKEVQQICKSKGGKCRSRSYINASTKMEIECAEGHQWKTTRNNLKKGQWCPKCNVFITEEICRAIFELAFHAPFPRSRPIPNPFKHGNLELDGYNEQLHFAFEYNGAQHYRVIQRMRNDISYQIQKDQYKLQWCYDHDIILIIVPYTIDISPINLYAYICDEYLKITGSVFPKIDFGQMHINVAYSHSKLDSLRQLLQPRGIICLSDQYINNHTKLHFQCVDGHDWWTTPHEIKNYGCPYCAKHILINPLVELQSIAREQCGQILSTKYVNNRTKIECECHIGHRWWAIPSNLKHGSWCPTCGHKKGIKHSWQSNVQIK
jgi:hypothetical protein